MPKTTFIATDSNGTIHTRKTERTYSHTVLAQRSKPNAIERAHKDVAYWTTRGQEQFLHADSSIEQIKAWLRAKRCDILCRDDVYATELQTKGKEFVAKWGTVEAYAAAQLADELAKIEATDWTVWHNLGWCGRPDLAQKLAATARGPGNAAVVMLEATAK